jgi:type III secretion HrpO family protein
MPSLGHLTELAESALMLAVMLSLPVVGLAALVGLLVAAFQAVTQLQDPTIAHLPRFLVVALVLAVVAPWMGSQISAFAVQAFSGG